MVRTGRWTRYLLRVEPPRPVDPRSEPDPAEGDDRSKTPDQGAVAGADAPAESSDAGDPASAAAGDPANAGKLPSVWNARSILLVVLAVFMAVCSAGVIVGYRLYDKAAEPDRSSPGVVVREYVNAAFNERDKRTIRRFTCGDPATVQGANAAVGEITAKERAHDTRITVTAENIESQDEGRTSNVTARLRLNAVVNGQSQEQIQQWEFSLKDRSGWRVCDARRVS